MVSQLKKNATSGMPFLKQHKCHINFNKTTVMLARHEFACVDKFGRPLVGGGSAGDAALHHT